MPAIRFDLKGKVAGMAVQARGRRSCDRMLLRLNADMLRDHPREMIQQTVPHEVAHVVTDFMHGHQVASHGREWRAVMHAFGKPPTRCHNMQAKASRKLHYYAYRCGCEAPKYLSSVRHRRIARGHVYSCPICRQILGYTGEAPVKGDPRQA